MVYENAQPALIRFDTAAQMEERLGGLIADHLALCIAKNGKASLALSGGSTPSGLYTGLSRAMLDWSSVCLALVDERFVPPDHNASNERMVRQTMMQNNAVSAGFVGLRGTAATLNAAAAEATIRLESMTRPFDVVVLGMGNDGHTASWFAGATGLDAALDTHNRTICLPIVAQNSPVAGAHKERLTLTLSALENAALCVLILKGQDKQDAYRRALDAGPAKDMPIRAIIQANMGAFWPCWAP